MKKSFVMAALSCLAPIALFGCQTAVPNAPIYAINYAVGTQQNQVIASGSSATLSVNVSSNTGGTVAGLVLSATVNNGYCSLPNTTVSTDASGNASLGVLAGSGGNLACTVAVSLPSVNASRAAVNFTINIRAIQRVLTAPVSSLSIATLPTPTTINLASTTAQMTLSSPNAVLGSANDSLNLRISNLPALPNTFTYVLWATNAASLTAGLDAFRNASNAPLAIGFNATPPVNTGTNSPVTPMDNKTNYNRVFVTIESGSAIPATPSTQIALDTGSSLFVQGK
jgi:hypothetical protein